jgi:glycosyltransferase involved in cell wall biosynthesis
MKKVLINISVVSKNHRGMGMFTKDILLKLLNDRSFEFILVSCTDIDETLKAIIENNKIFYRQINSPLPLFEQLILPLLIKKYKVDSCWFPSNTFPIYKVNNVKYIATIHDIIFLDDKIVPKNIYQKVGKYYRAFNILKGIKKLDVITSVSFSALKEIYNYFNIQDNILDKQVLYNSINLDFSFDNSILEKLNLKDKKYIYTISGNAFHKNLSFLLQSFNKFNKIYTEYCLVITGVPESYHNQYNTKNVIFTNYISNNEKYSLIKNADFFVFASLKEGFGIPLVEAMSLNSNILASDIDVFREIGKQYMNYFSPVNTDFLIEYLKNNNNIKNDLSEVKLFINNTFNINQTVKKLKHILKGIK